jgi:hypothetical protein
VDKPPQSKINFITNSVFVSPVTEDDVQMVVRTLKGKYSAGYDEIPECLVKEYIQFIKTPLTFIFSMSLQLGIFQDLMKVAKIRPIYKKGEKQDITNYRPISLLSVFSKVLEKLVYKRVLTFLYKHNMLTESQNGLRENKSIDTATQSFIEDVQHAVFNRLLVMGIFLDLTKAYDVINHNNLLAQLDNYGLRGTIN